MATSKISVRKAGRPTNATTWSMKEAIDFEFLLLDEAGVEPNARWKKDRKLYEGSLRFQVPIQHPRRKQAVFRSWVAAHRDSGRYLPGEDVVVAWKLVFEVSLVAAFLFGLLYSGGALLLLQEDRHVSATRFFLLTVGLQVALTLVSIGL